MPFKDSQSFERLLTMGARGVRKVVRVLEAAGFVPIELERYSGSNKVWATKIKRLRMPDLVCVRTGTRFEVKVKSKLAIKMSHSPTNALRAWDSGLTDNDIIAFVTADDERNFDTLSESDANFFTVGALRATRGKAEQSAPKSVGEGAEVDLSWSSYVPGKSGSVVEIVRRGKTATHLKFDVWDDEGTSSRQTYSLRKKISYLEVDDSFRANSTIVAGVPKEKARLSDYVENEYNPIAILESPASPIERFAAVKVLPYRPEVRKKAKAVLVSLLDKETDLRLQVEVAASCARMELNIGEVFLRELAFGDAPDDLKMEAVFILTEIQTDFAAITLRDLASAADIPSEVRQAAVWGLGVSGHRKYSELVPFLSDHDDAVVLHAIASFGGDTPGLVISRLVNALNQSTQRVAAAASEAIVLVGGDEAVTALVAVETKTSHRNWALATLARFPKKQITNLLVNPRMRLTLEPLFAMGQDNWVAQAQIREKLTGLLSQRSDFFDYKPKTN